jgi:hypothetical protein
MGRVAHEYPMKEFYMIKKLFTILILVSLPMMLFADFGFGIQHDFFTLSLTENIQDGNAASVYGEYWAKLNYNQELGFGAQLRLPTGFGTNQARSNFVLYSQLLFIRPGTEIDAFTSVKAGYGWFGLNPDQGGFYIGGGAGLRFEDRFYLSSNISLFSTYTTNQVTGSIGIGFLM